MTKSKRDIFLNDRRVCCVSDIHIGVHQNSAQWHEIILNWSKWLAVELREQNIKDIIISGDFFHYRDEIAVNTIHFVKEILDEWKEFNIIILVGNHDAYYKDRSDVNSLTILEGWPNITIVPQLRSETIFGKKITFVPWGVEVKDIPESDIVFGHFEINSFKQTNFKVCQGGVSSKDLLNKTNLVITGHFHLREERKYNNGTILYLGSPFQMDFGDVDSTKGYYILDVEDKTFNFFENKKSPKHVKLLLSELVKQKKLTKEVTDSLENSFVKFIIDRNIAPDEIDFIVQKLNAYKPISVNVDYANNFNMFAISDDARKDLSGIDIEAAIEEFIDLMDIDNKTKVTQYTLELYKNTLQ
jgi:DNA repair exonuclease SbcCD nuclease subunit